jgi:hypothetical protein
MGLSYSQTVNAALVVLLISFWYADEYGYFTTRHLRLAKTIPLRSRAASLLEDAYGRERSFWLWRTFSAAPIAVWALCHFVRQDFRLTIWGFGASRLVYIALIFVTLSTLAFFWASIRVVQRIAVWCQAAKDRLGARICDELLLSRIAPTPIAAGNYPCPCEADSAQERSGHCELALRLSHVLATEILLYRWATGAAAVSSMTAAWMVYLFPITDGDDLLLINIALLALTGLYFAHNTVRFERDQVLSRLLCNRPEKTQFSMALFGYVALPFVVIAVVIAITQVPGVLDWGGGIFSLAKNTLDLAR